MALNSELFIMKTVESIILESVEIDKIDMHIEIGLLIK